MNCEQLFRPGDDGPHPHHLHDSASRKNGEGVVGVGFVAKREVSLSHVVSRNNSKITIDSDMFRLSRVESSYFSHERLKHSAISEFPTDYFYTKL